MREAECGQNRAGQFGTLVVSPTRSLFTKLSADSRQPRWIEHVVLSSCHSCPQFRSALIQHLRRYRVASSGESPGLGPYLFVFANACGTRIKLLLHDGFGLLCATGRLNQDLSVSPGAAVVTLNGIAVKTMWLDAYFSDRQLLPEHRGEVPNG